MVKKLEDYEWICSQPFANVSTDPYGVYQPCCMAYFEERLTTDEDWEKLLTKKDLKNVSTDSFSDYYRSNYMTKVRDAFRKGDKEFVKASLTIFFSITSFLNLSSNGKLR